VEVLEEVVDEVLPNLSISSLTILQRAHEPYACRMKVLMQGLAQSHKLLPALFHLHYLVLFRRGGRDIMS
jgi:hypothetical protein